MDHIEYTISEYADAMSPALFEELSAGDKAFLHEHTSFLADIRRAVDTLESWLGSSNPQNSTKVTQPQ